VKNRRKSEKEAKAEHSLLVILLFFLG